MPTIGADISSHTIPIVLPAMNGSQTAHPVLFYQLSFRPDDVDTFTTAEQRIEPGTAVFYFNVAPHQDTYHLRLAAGNDAGVSEWSEVVTIKLIPVGEYRAVACSCLHLDTFLILWD